MARRQTGGRFRAALFLLVSVGAAGVASAVVFSVITNYQNELATAVQPELTVPVMVAATELAQGRTIAQTDLAVTDLPPDYVPDSVLRQPEQAIGRVPRERILAREFIREERLADPESGVGLNAIIPRGMRALSINISNGSAVSGFLNPGNYVDVLVTLEGDEDRKTETVTMLQAVTVLAVNDRIGSGQSGTRERSSPSVTVAVTPEQAERLTHAAVEARVVLTLRNDIDVTRVETHGARSEALLGGETSEKRIEVSEWKERASQKRDGTLLIIKGGNTRIEKVQARD